MSGFWKTIRGYFWWTYERGSLHYDVMVTIILLFIFLAPRYISFKDKPSEPSRHPIEVVLNPDGKGGFSYRVEASAVDGKSGDELDQALINIIEPVSGEVRLLDKTAIKDRFGKIQAYIVRVQRQ